MKKDNKFSPETLRQQAERLFKRRPEKRIQPRSESEMLILIHELELQKLELEIQNEALVAAKSGGNDSFLKYLGLSKDTHDHTQGEEKYLSIFESMQDAFYEATIDGILLDISPSIEIISKGQYTRAELIGTPLAGYYLNNDDRNTFLSDLFILGHLTDYKIAFKNKDGSIVPVSISSNILFENEVPVKITGIMRDMTERKQAENAIRESEILYRAILNASPDDITITDLEGRILVVTPVALEIFGFSHENELLGHQIADFVAPADYERAVANFNLMFEGIRSGPVVYQVKHADGSFFDAEVIGDFIFENDGKPSKMIFVIRDITERRKAENALLESEKRFRSLANSGQALIWTADTDKKCTYFNQVWLDFTGRTMEQEYGYGWTEGVHPRDFDRCLEIFSTSFDKREPFSMDYRLRRRDGEYRWLQDNGTPQFDSAGRFIGYIGHCLDISDLKLAQEALIRSEEKYRNIFIHAQEGIFQTNYEGSYLSINPALAKMYGFDSPQELMSSRNNIAEDAYNDPRERENFLRIMEEQGFVKGYEYEVKRKDGQRIWFYEDAQAIKDEQGKILFFEGFVVDITERKEVENTLKDKTALLTNLIINLQEGILLENAKRQIALTNQLFCEMFGIPAPPELLKGADCTESAEQSKALFKNPEKFVTDIGIILVNKTAVYSDELELVDGRFFERDYIPTYLENEYSGHLWKYRDITERKQSQLKIEESEERFRQVVGQSREVVWEVDDTGLYTYVSPLSMQVYGYTPEQLVGKMHFYDIAPEDGREAFRQAAMSMFDKKITFENLNNSVCRLDGKVITVTTNGIPMLNENGVLIGYRGIDSDITEKVLAENIRKKSEEVYRLITERSNDLIYVFRLKPDMGFEYVSPSAERITGFTPEDHYNDPQLGLKLVHPDDIHLLQSWQNGTICADTITLRWIKKDGSVIWTESQNIPIYNERGDIIAIQGRATDITERKQAEMILNARLRLTDFAASHSRNELQQKLLDELEQLTGSSIGFFHAVNTDQETLILQSWSSNTMNHMCKADSKNLHYNIDKAGIWAECVGERKAVIHNDYLSVKNRKGIPEGHAPVIRELVVPIFRNELIVAIVGIGNKANDYNEKDIELVSRLADLSWDITERKGAEESLKKLSQAVEQSPEVIYITNSEGIIEYVNPKARELTGYSDKELIGKNPRIFNSGEKSAEEYSNLWQTIASGNDWKGDFHNKKKNGELYWVAASISPVTDTNGKITHYLAVEEDITERKKTEDKIKQQNERLNAIVSAMPDLIFVIDTQGTYLEFYQSNTNLKLIPVHEVIGTNIKEFFNKEQADNYRQNIQSCIQENKLIYFHYQLTEKNSTNYYEARITPCGNDKVLSFVRDVTERVYAEMEIQNLNANLELKIVDRTSQLYETNLNLHIEIEDRKRAEEEIIKARNEAEKANLAKSEFLSRMSHELRTPMNSILGFAQLMDMGDLTPLHRKGVNHILNSGKHLLDLINEVLDISRIEAGRISLSMEPIKLSPVILEMLDIVQPQAAKRNLAIELLDSPSNTFSVIADNQRFKQVILNLINNAIKYNREGGCIKIKTELLSIDSKQKPRIRISVIDTGIGIKTEEINKLFLPFERIGAEKTETEGTGLGLTVVKKLMDAMGGSVGVESIPGTGSTFWIELLQSKNKLNNMKELVSAMDSDSSEGAILGTILYIEDNASNIELVEQILAARRSNVRLISNKTGIQALSLALQYTPDLILLDLDLPDIHGSVVLKNLQENDETRTIPVVIISADAMHHQVEKLIGAGARKYLTKPLHVLDYLKVIDEFIAK